MDPSGRVIARLFEGDVPRGAHVFNWDGMTDDGLRAPSGVYFYRLSSKEAQRIEKMVLLR